MPRPALKILPFPVKTEITDTLQNYSVHPVLTVVKARPLISPPPENRPFLMRHGGYALAVVVTIALHSAWLSTATNNEPEPQAKIPTVLSVSWLPAPLVQATAKPKPEVKTPPKPQAKPKKLPKVPNKTPQKTLAKPSKPLLASTQASRTVAMASAISVPPPFQPSSVAATAQAAPSPAPAATPKAVAEPVTLPHLNADYLHNPAPDYPPASRELGEQGRVLVRAKISIDGKVEQVLLRKSSGYSRLDEAALTSVKQWRFVPAQQGAQQVAAWVVVPVAFSLEG